MDCGHSFVYFRRLVGVGVMAAILTTAFVPAMAASQTQPTDSSAFSNKSIAKVVANTTPDAAVRVNPTASEAAKATKTQSGNSGPFFKTPAGLVVLAVMAVGTGYALYSVKEDRIRGSIR